MVDAIAPLSFTPGLFDTAAIQIAEAQAQAAVAHTDPVVFLTEIAKKNDEANAHALDKTPPAPTSDVFNNSLLNVDPDVGQILDPTIDPSSFSAFQFSAGLTPAPTADSLRAQQLQDAATLQKDAVLLEEAAHATNHIPLTANASTVDLSVEAQGVVDGTRALTSAQLAQIGQLLQPIANAPLTPALLQHIEAQLAAQQNPIRLSLNTLALAMSFIAGMEPSSYHEIETIAAADDMEVTVEPALPIDRVAVEDSAILL